MYCASFNDILPCLYNDSIGNTETADRNITHIRKMRIDA